MPLAAPISTHAAPEENAPLLPPGVGSTFLLVSVIFALWGIPNNLNDVLIRQFMKSFELTRTQAGLVQSAFYLGYFILALPAGVLMRRHGYKAGFLTGLILFACGCLCFPFAANSGHYAAFLAALFVIASGLAFLETAASPFIAQLGPTASSERRLNIAQTFNSLGAILGSYIGTRFIFSGEEMTPARRAAMQAAGTYIEFLHRETQRIVAPYLVLGGIVILWAVLIARQRFPNFIHQREHAAESGDWRALLTERHFLFSLLAQFAYVGSQVGVWSYLIPYAREYVHVTDRTGGTLLTGTLIAFALGRLSSSAIMSVVSPSRLMAVYAGINVALIAVGVFVPGRTGVGAILASSFFMSLMFPTIFGLGIKDLGANTTVAGSLLVMTIVGGALLPLCMGAIADHLHATAFGYIVPLGGFALILGFSLYMNGYNRERLLRSTFDL